MQPWFLVGLKLYCCITIVARKLTFSLSELVPKSNRKHTGADIITNPGDLRLTAAHCPDSGQ